MRPGNFLRRFLPALTIPILSLVATAQPLPGAGAFAAGPGAEGHGWLVVGPAAAPVLVHVPPRGLVDLGDGRRASGSGGSVRLGARLNSTPEGIAARGREVYLMFGAGGGQRRLVLRASVRPAPVGNTWDADQAERLEAMPSLDAPGRLLGFAGTDAGPAALLADRKDNLSLFILREREWEPMPLPPELETGVAARLVALPIGLAVFAETADGRAALWRGATDPAAGTPWTATEMPKIGLDAENGPRSLFWAGGGLVYAMPTAQGLGIRIARPSGVFPLAVLPGVGDRYAVAPVFQPGRIVVVWAQVSPDVPATPPTAGPLRERAYFVREVSPFTGRILYDGPPSSAWPFSLLEFRLLAVVLLGIVAGVLVFVLRPDQGDGAVLLPKGTALAEPWRRAVAGTVDLAIAWLMFSWLSGVTFESLFVPGFRWGIASTLVMVVGLACLHCTLGEWAFGRSAGKALAGCRVVATGTSGDPAPGEGPPRRPPFRAALIRNLLRWGVAPLGLAALGTPGGRHRGDLLARTAVVVVITDPEAGEGP